MLKDSVFWEWKSNVSQRLYLTAGHKLMANDLLIECCCNILPVLG